MNFLLPIYIWPIFRLLSRFPAHGGAGDADAEAHHHDLEDLDALPDQEAGNGPDVDWQEKIHRGTLRGLRNISETP